MNEELKITNEDLIDWIDRPPSNDDLDLCSYLVNAVEKQHNWNELKKWLEEEIYNIEPKGTAINYNCEYDSEEDYINAMKERSKLITLKRVLIILQEIEGKSE